MTDSPPLRITKSTRKDTRTRFRSGKRHPRWIPSYDPDMVGIRYGYAEIISPRIRKTKGYCEVLTRCTSCQRRRWINLNNLRRGKSRGCQSCSQTQSPHVKVLGRRYDAIKARCTNPNNPGYRNYGGRGITCEFSSRMEFIRYVEQHLPHTDYREVEIDREDNNGPYAPGNLRLVTRRQNVMNRSNTVWIKWQGERIPLSEFPSPYSATPTQRYARQGMTGEQIIERAWQSVHEKRKGWRALRERLMSMTSSMPVPDTDLR